MYGETGGGEVVRADGLGTEGTAEAGGVLGELGEGVAGGRCKTAEAYASVLVCEETLARVGKENGPAEVAVNEKKRAVRSLVGRNEAIELRLCQEGAQLLGHLKPGAQLSSLGIGECARIELHPETERGGNIAAKLERRAAPRVEVRAHGNM